MFQTPPDLVERYVIDWAGRELPDDITLLVGACERLLTVQPSRRSGERSNTSTRNGDVREILQIFLLTAYELGRKDAKTH